MKPILLSFFVLLSMVSAKAQERYVDDIFTVAKPITQIYASKEGENLELDIYMPSGDTLSQRPVIIFMHGGGFSGGSRTNEDEVKFAETAARKGYVTVQISYRLTRKGQSFSCDYEASGKIKTFQLAAEDFMDAVNFMVNNSEKYRINPSQIIAGGSSAGAEAILNAVYNEPLMFDDLDAYKNMRFAGVFSLAGAIVDARYMTSENSVPGVFFHGTKDNLVPYGSAPHHQCDRESPGYLILDGSKTITDRLKELESSYLLYSFEGGMHEHSGMPFEHLPQVFSFFRDVFLEKEKQQIRISR